MVRMQALAGREPGDRPGAAAFASAAGCHSNPGAGRQLPVFAEKGPSPRAAGCIIWLSGLRLSGAPPGIRTAAKSVPNRCPDQVSY